MSDRQRMRLVRLLYWLILLLWIGIMLDALIREGWHALFMLTLALYWAVRSAVEWYRHTRPS